MKPISVNKLMANLQSLRNKAYCGVRIESSDFVIRNDHVIGMFRSDEGLIVNTVFHHDPVTVVFDAVYHLVQIDSDQLDWMKSEIVQIVQDFSK